MSDEAKVAFLVGGVQKGGTTALFRYLDELPGLAMASMKETHFFDDEEGVDWGDPDYARYHALFPAFDGRPRGEATPIYLYWPHALPRIARYAPAIKLVFLFRDPVERAWSQWKMETARGWEREPFGWCIRQGRARVDTPEAPGFHRVYSYVERGFYGAQLQRALQLFPREQMLLIRSDALDREPQATLANLCRFVGAEPPAVVAPRRELVAQDIDYGSRLTEADVAELRGLYADDLALFERLSGLSTADWRNGPAVARPSQPSGWRRILSFRRS